MTDRHSGRAHLEKFLHAHALDFEEVNETTIAVVVPGEKKLTTTASFAFGDTTVTVNAFVIRHPDENDLAVYRWLLERNRRMYGLAYSIDHHGDIYLTGRFPLDAITDAELDRIFGAISEYADGAFNSLLEVGFVTAIAGSGSGEPRPASQRTTSQPSPTWPTRTSQTSRRGQTRANSAPSRTRWSRRSRTIGQNCAMTTNTSTLILLRHGESEWNAKNLFTGWVDVDLTDTGRQEATRGGELLASSGLLPDVVHTSLLTRAIRTSQLALEAANRQWIPVRRTWRLNERHYGALQGKDKKETLAEYGEEQFMLWRRSYDVPPPPIEPDDPFAQTNDPRYAALPPEARPATECLADVVRRLIPYWEDVLVADDLRAGRTVLVAAHGNSLRAMVKHLDDISDTDIAGVNIPTGIPLVYRLDGNLRPVVPGGEYLDPDAAATAAAAVAAQGKA